MIGSRYTTTQVRKLCSYLQSCNGVEYYEHPFGGDEVTVIAIATINYNRVAYQTSFYDPFNPTDTEYVLEEGLLAYRNNITDLMADSDDY